MSSLIALDTSVAVPLLVRSHRAHPDVVRWWQGRALALSGHSFAETYAVLTRLPGDARLAAADAASLLAERFAAPLLLTPEVQAGLPRVLAELGIVGGATYDATVALAAAAHGCVLATRDGRASATYDLVGVQVETVV